MSNLGDVGCDVGDKGQGDGMIVLNKTVVGVPAIVLAFDHAMTVNFSVSTNLLPRDFSINYTTSNGVLTNAMLHLDNNWNEKAR